MLLLIQRQVSLSLKVNFHNYMATKTTKTNKGGEMVDVNKIIIRPRITEKSTMVAEDRVYTFEISETATKIDIKTAIKALYNVTPIKIRVLAVLTKNTFIRGQKGTKGGGRKAFVYFKKGDKIELI